MDSATKIQLNRVSKALKWVRNGKRHGGEWNSQLQCLSAKLLLHQTICMLFKLKIEGVDPAHHGLQPCVDEVINRKRNSHREGANGKQRAPDNSAAAGKLG